MQSISILRETSPHSRLKHGASFRFADLMNAESEIERLTQGEICRILGLSDEVVDVMLEKLETDFFPLSFDMLKRFDNKTIKTFHQYFKSNSTAIAILLLNFFHGKISLSSRSRK